MEHILRIGKITENALKRSVLKQIRTDGKHGEPEDAVTAADCAFLADGKTAVTADPVTLPARIAGRLAVIAAVNDLWSGGAVPETVTTVVLLPPGTPEEELRRLEQQIADTCREEQVKAAGGHTEVTAAVTRPVITAAGVGCALRPQTGRQETAALEGMEIVASKYIALEGTAILAMEKGGDLQKRFAAEFLERSCHFADVLSVAPEARIALEQGAVLLHDASEGGILAALWTLAQKAGTGLDVDLKKIPVRQETIEIAGFFDIDPYRMESAGCLLMVSGEGQKLAEELESRGIPASVIGKLTGSRDRILRSGDEIRFLERPQPDALLEVVGMPEGMC
jgi:hydrogenase expression/formation protein HypE